MLLIYDHIMSTLRVRARLQPNTFVPDKVEGVGGWVILAQTIFVSVNVKKVIQDVLDTVKAGNPLKT